MAEVTINDNPVESDTIVFDLPTPDANGCFVDDPYKVDSVVIYFVERDFANPNEKQYDVKNYQSEKLTAAEDAEAVACAAPTAANIATAKLLRTEAENEAKTTPFFYNEARPIKVVGNSEFPAWLSTDADNAFIDQITEDEDGNALYGRFSYSWDTTGMREGDYFVCWTWTPLPAGDKISQHAKFNIGGNTVLTTSIPSHYTNPVKYETLLERYLPEMFKLRLTEDDRTPDVLENFNKAVADGFTTLENLGNQIVDLLDANSTHENFLPLLSNYFDLKLKTNDPTLWRRQIKNAVPLYKKKGTKKGLEEALAQAGIKMTKYTRLWQVISSYTWIDAFTYDGSTDSWELSKVALDVDYDNFSVSLRPAGEDVYIDLSMDYVEFSTVEGVTTVTWVGNTLSVEPIDLVSGDILKVLYKYTNIPGTTEQTIENYVRTLPLADDRDEREQEYPLKNWNVRVIEEDDPLFSIVVPERHPFHENLVFGQVRTEFPYSENAYNKDEYNGSIRNSKDPADIDRNFIDPCSSGVSGKFNIDLEIENLSDDRITEAQDVIREFVPFHAVMQTMNVMGGINEFMNTPVEEIEILINVSGEEFVIAGQGQMWFNRAMKGGTTTDPILRTDLADSEVVVTSTGTAYNDSIAIFSPDVRFDKIGMGSEAILEILAPSANAGTSTITYPSGNTAEVSSAAEPLNTAAFTFRVSSELETNGTLCDVAQDNLFTFTDSENDYSLFDIKSSWDVEHNGAAGAWTVTISGNAYTVLNILPGQGLILEDDTTLPTTNASGLTYILKDYSGTTIHESDAGVLTIKKRGRVTVDSSLEDVRNFIRGSCYMLIASVEYKVNGFVPGNTNEFYIDEYKDGSGADLGANNGLTLVVRQRLIGNSIGYLTHRGLRLKVAGDLETSLGIQNGHRHLVDEEDWLENDNFKENFLVTINGENYFITDIDGNSPAGSTTIRLSGSDNNWTTSGTAVSFTITKYTKKSVTIPGQQFDLGEATFRTYDRSGREVIDSTITDDDSVSMLSVETGDDNIVETVSQNESVSFTIEWDDGTIQQGVV